MNDETMCHCGRPLHYESLDVYRVVCALIARLGPYVPVVYAGRTWRVQRHYIALHGLKGADVPHLGFEEVTEGTAG